MSLELVGVAKTFGSVRAVDGVSLKVASGEFFTLLRPSGCGKTTLLRLVAGIHPATGGQVMLGGRDITHAPMHARNLAMVFQNYALFPHLNVFDNVAFGLRSRRVGREEIRTRVREALALVKLEALAERMPAQLSGGQQERVAVARALVVRPDLLLFDEPLSNLDARLRDEMRFEIRDLQRRIGITTVLVTHDIEEAFTMSDRVAWLPDREDVSGRTALSLILRPESLRVSAGDTGTENSYLGEIEDVIYLGANSECRLKIGALSLSALMPSAAAARLRPGERVSVGWNAVDGVVVDAG